VKSTVSDTIETFQKRPKVPENGKKAQKVTKMKNRL